MEVAKLAEELFNATIVLDELMEKLAVLAFDKVEAERKYRMNLAKMILLLRNEGLPMSIINDVARGKLSDLKFERDMAETNYRLALMEVDGLKTKISALQSINRHQSDV